MSTSNASMTSRYTRFLRPALAVAALVIGAATVQAQTDGPGNGAPNATGTQRSNTNPQGTPQNPAVQANPDGKVEKAVTDSWITTKVKSEILANSASKAFKVNVTTKSGVVALKGKLPTQDAVDLVKSLAQGVKGVQSVDASGLSVSSTS